MTLKVVLHVPDSTRYKVALNMGVNFLKTRQEGEKLEARLLVNAQGITILLEDFPPEIQNKMEEFLKLGGEIYFCENAMRAFNVPRERVPNQTRTVPAGIRALVEWQAEGWAYVRP
ncbi:MAG: hypothetical protein GXO20_08065 [Thermodesulfobacteria bacterium]|nr:hypothetical protein [Thermodesulfobacteriota bacterium]